MDANFHKKSSKIPRKMPKFLPYIFCIAKYATWNDTMSTLLFWIIFRG